MNKNTIIIEALEDLELSPTAELDARNKYKAITNLLSEKGGQVHLTPQGSFQMGTVVKPYKDAKDKNYDLDVVCILEDYSKTNQASDVKNFVGDTLKNNKNYSRRLKEDSVCWILEYVGSYVGTDFIMELIPAIWHNKSDNIMYYNDYKERLLHITEKISDKYFWKDSNSLDFGDWFLDINNNFLTSEIKGQQFRSLNQKLPQYFSSADEVPKFLYKTNLQRAIQFLKRNRDIYFDSINKFDFKPSSFLLTALVTDSVKNYFYLNIDEIILKFIKDYENGNISIIEGNFIRNPIDESETIEDDLKNEKLILFNKWLTSLKIQLLSDEEVRFKEFIHNQFNNQIFRNELKAYDEVIPRKPWAKND